MGQHYKTLTTSMLFLSALTMGCAKMPEAWNWELQRQETIRTVEHLSNQQGVPLGLKVVLDIQTVPGANPSRSTYLSELTDSKLSFVEYEDAENGATIEVTIPDVVFGVNDIWANEQRVTEIAIRHGYRPDGWGFSSDRRVD